MHKIKNQPKLFAQIIKPKRFLLTYRKQNGETQSYEISNPIEAQGDKFTTYCFSRHALRTFVIDKVLDLKEIRVVRKIK